MSSSLRHIGQESKCNGTGTIEGGESMIEFKTGDILSEDAEALVNTVNCVGVMGRGIALQFKKALPENFKAYAAACRRGEVEPGRMFVFEMGRMVNPKYVINFPTKRHWRAKSRMDDIDAGLDALVEEIRGRHIRSIAIPPLGSGLGGLDWNEVRPRIEAALRELDDLKVIVFEPGGRPRSTVRSSRVPEMTAGRAALIGLMNRYLNGFLDPFVTLLEVHKLMYFLQVAQEPLKLRFSKGHYGPYADNLRHVLNEIEGHFLVGYADGGDAPGKELKLLPGALAKAEARLARTPATLERFERVSNLVAGFESPSGLELLATVHWVVDHERPDSEDDVVSKVHAWNTGKRRFSKRQVGLALDVLVTQEWVGGEPWLSRRTPSPPRSTASTA